MSRADELAYVSTTELAERIRSRDLSPVEVVDACIERIEARNPSLNAFVFLGFDDARAAAKEAEKAVTSGAELGVLHGVPVAMKDLFDFKPGWKSTFGGIRALKDLVIDDYCEWAKRIEEAGAILVGKTNSPVMGLCGATDNPLFGPTRNPWDTTRNSGGSSGGSAAAVADGILSLAEGTDGGGSIRIPSSWCGVYGFQPSFGRVANYLRPNAFFATQPFIYEGPITRTVDDAALAMTAINGGDPRDPFCIPGKVDFRDATSRSLKGARIAYSRDLGVYPVDPRVTAVVEEALGAFRAAGAHVEEVQVELKRSHMELADLWCAMIAPLNVGAIEFFKANGLDLLADHRDDFPPGYLHWMEVGAGLSAQDVLHQNDVRSEVFDALQGVFADHDYLVSPTLACLPVENADDGHTVGPTELNGEPVNPQIGWCMTYFTNFSGHPAASIPAGFADGLPVGLQIIGPRQGDADVLAASAAFERERPWFDSYARLRERPLT